MLKHETLLIDLSEWSDEGRGRNASTAMGELLKFLSDHGFVSLEMEITKVVQDFAEAEDINVTPKQKDSFTDKLPSKTSVYTTCLKNRSSLIFFDIESPEEVLQAEFDIFSTDPSSLNLIKHELTENTMKCFGLTKTKESVVLAQKGSLIPHAIAGRLNPKEPLSDALFQRLREEGERLILRELRKRGSILESDLNELATPEVPIDRVKKTLDYLSGDDYKLVERKFAIVCTESQEIIFLLKSKEDIASAKSLECPKCSRQIGNETVLHYYASTDNLKLLLDGNRWMPLLIRDALIKAGVPPGCVLTEVKHGEDEIDLLVFYEKRILVIEAKNRPVSLNDAYKLSAKTSRIESITSKGRGEVGVEDWADVGALQALDIAWALQEGSHRPLKERVGSFIPIVISTHDVAKDAKDLLVDTKSSALVLENCESGLDSFIRDLVQEIDRNEVETRLKKVISQNVIDSVSNLAAFRVQQGIARWYEAMVKGGESPLGTAASK